MNVKLQNHQSASCHIEFRPSGAQVFYSNQTPVAALLPNGMHVKTEEFHSRTTSKHINWFLEGNSFLNMRQSELDQL